MDPKSSARLFEVFTRRVGKFLVLLAAGACLTPQRGYSQVVNPTLQIQATNGVANLSWTGAGYWLQAADFLDDPIAWYNSPWAQGGTGPDFNTVVPMDLPMRFFRLISSPFLAPPTGLNAQAGDSLMFVTWNAVPNALTYNLYF